MIRPQALKPGDRIRIVAPARKISLEELEPALAQIEAWGFEAFYTPELFAEENQFAGKDSIRQRDLQAALDDPKCRAILCARGGYGSVRIVDQLHYQGLKTQPKWFLGYSDVTVFHSALHREGIMSMHCSMPIDFKRATEASLNSLQLALKGEAYAVNAEEHPYNKPGSCEAAIIGGNLSMLYSLLGSPEQLDLHGKILFIEDLDEYLYHVDRMFYNLQRNHYFENLAGILVGSLTDMNDNKIPFGEDAEEIARRHFEHLDIPIGFGIPAGHLNDNQTLIFGLSAQVQVDSNGTSIRFSHADQQTRTSR